MTLQPPEETLTPSHFRALAAKADAVMEDLAKVIAVMAEMLTEGDPDGDA